MGTTAENGGEAPDRQTVAEIFSKTLEFVSEKPEEVLNLRQDKRRVRELLEWARNHKRGLDVKPAEAEEARRLPQQWARNRVEDLKATIDSLLGDLSSKDAERKTVEDLKATIDNLHEDLSLKDAERLRQAEDFSLVREEMRAALLKVQEDKERAERQSGAREVDVDETLQQLIDAEKERDELKRERDELRERLDRAQERRPSQVGKPSRIEHAYEEAVKCLAPRLKFVNRGSASVLAKEYKDCEAALRLLHELDAEPVPIKFKPVKGAKPWREAAKHFNIGTGPDGRLYYREADEVGSSRRYLVHLGTKQSQDSDIELLKKNR